jgi:hypothetical protein
MFSSSQMALQVDLSIGHHIFCGKFTAAVYAALQLSKLQYFTSGFGYLLLMSPFLLVCFCVLLLVCNSHISSWMLGVLKEELEET